MGQHIAFFLDTYVHVVLYAKPHRHTPFRVGEQFSQAACHDQSNPCKTHCKKYIYWRLMFHHHVCGDVTYIYLDALHVPAFLHWLSYFEFIIVRVCGLVHVYPNGHTHTHIYIYIHTYIHIRAYTYTYLHIDVIATDTYQYVKISKFHIFACVSLTNHWLLLAGHDEAASAWCNSFLLSLSPPPLSALSETPGSWDSWACLGPNTCHVCQNRCRIECPNRCQQVR